MKNKKIPLPVTEQEYKIIKMFCLVRGLKYSDLTKLFIKFIEGMDDDQNNNNFHDV